MPIDIDSLPIGTATEIRLEIARLPSSTVIDLPVQVFRGQEEGPCLLLTAALHGDEIVGTEALRQLARQGQLLPLKGTVLSLPIVNIYGFLHQSRTLPDGKDLNRSFPGRASGSLASRLARVLMDEVVPRADWIIDLHTGGASRTNYPQVRCDFTRQGSLQLAEAFGAPLLLNSSEIKGSFRKAVSALDKNIIVYEGGESLRLDQGAAREACLGIRRVMQFLGMVESELEMAASKVLEKSRWLRASTSGVFVPAIEYGEQVQKGQVMAQLGDPYGNAVSKVKAPFDGFVIGLNNQAIVHAGDALIHLGQAR